MKKIFIILLLSSSIFAVTIFACENCILGTAAGVGICYPTYLGFTHTCCEKTVWQSPESNARITNFSLCPEWRKSQNLSILNDVEEVEF